MKKKGYVINYILLLVCILASLSHVESYETMMGQMSYFAAQSKAGLAHATPITAQECDKETLTTALQAEAHVVANGMGAPNCDDATSVDYAAAPANNSRADYLKAIGYITSADACTAEMLGSARPELLNRTALEKKDEAPKKGGARSNLTNAAEVLQEQKQLYAFTDLRIKAECTDTAGVIRFIHSKDGKKRI